MNKKELVNRWKNAEGNSRLEEVIKVLGSRKHLSSLPWLDKYQGRWDLRGARLSTVVEETKIVSEGYSFVKKEGTLKLKNMLLESVDFSFSNINNSVFTNVTFRDCMFDDTMGKGIKIFACNFENVFFKNCNLSYSFLAENIGKDSGAFVRTHFIKTNLKESLFCFPVMKDCVFDNCNLNAVDFDGSRMTNCEFKGRVDSAWFGGYSLKANKSILGIFNRIDPHKYPNPMDNINFSEAVLIGVAFRHKIDLSRCIFPNDPNCLLIRDAKNTFTEARKEIVQQWEGEDKRLGLHVIDNAYYGPCEQDQKMTVIDKYGLIQAFDERFANLLFSLISKINNNDI